MSDQTWLYTHSVTQSHLLCSNICSKTDYTKSSIRLHTFWLLDVNQSSVASSCYTDLSSHCIICIRTAVCFNNFNCKWKMSSFSFQGNAVIALKTLHDDAWKTFILLHSNKQLFNKRAWMHFTHKSQDTGVMWFIHSSGRGWSSEEAEEEEHGAGLFKCSKCWETKSPSQLWGWLPSQSVTVSLWGLLVMFASETVIFSDHFSHHVWSMSQKHCAQIHKPRRYAQPI